MTNLPAQADGISLNTAGIVQTMSGTTLNLSIPITLTTGTLNNRYSYYVLFPNSTISGPVAIPTTNISLYRPSFGGWTNVTNINTSYFVDFLTTNTSNIKTMQMQINGYGSYTAGIHTVPIRIVIVSGNEQTASIDYNLVLNSNEVLEITASTVNPQIKIEEADIFNPSFIKYNDLDTVLKIKANMPWNLYLITSSDYSGDTCDSYYDLSTAASSGVTLYQNSQPITLNQKYKIASGTSTIDSNNNLVEKPITVRYRISKKSATVAPQSGTYDKHINYQIEKQ
ncbi:MAG: hypothetical protein PHV37_08950 [Candidatus Gastranaerophilales bacterium]|nr:hypothetical protein [Candidatus Gastranaerophilales bacterium]